MRSIPRGPEANERAVSTLSTNATMVTPSAAGRRQRSTNTAGTDARESSWDVADDRDPVVLERERDDGGPAASIPISGAGPRQRRGGRGARERRGEHERRHVDVAEVREGDPSSWRKESPSTGDPGHLAELADDHQRGDAGHVADEHRLGQQLGEEAEPRQPMRHTKPTATASSAATSRVTTPAAVTSGPTPAAVISAVVDSGPTDSCRDDPSRA